MANPEHLAILKQGVEVWNRWRNEHLALRPDLSEADLNRSVLSRVALSGTNLIRASLIRANLSEAYLIGADLSEANLCQADLRQANLSGTNLIRTNLSDANLSEARLRGANLSSATVGRTHFSGIDLSTVKGLGTLKHLGPSYIDFQTLTYFQDQIPEAFLRGVGIPDIFIKFLPSLTKKAIQFYSCFISYSNKDEIFTQRLHADLQQKGVRCWFAPEDLKIGDKIRSRIDETIRIHDKLLVILSENSMQSDWVEDEVETAIEEERKRGEAVLFPIRLDDTVMDTDQAWAAKLRRTRHIGDFSRWKDHDAYQQAFERLLRDLKAEG